MKFLCALFSLFYCQFIWSQTAVNQAQVVLNEMIIEEMQKKNIPGVALGFFLEGKGYIICYGVADTQSRTPITPTTIFDIASVTKVFTSTELALQAEKRLVNLNDPVVKYLPGMNFYQGAIRQVTLLDLATHSSSLPRDLPSAQANSYQGVINFLNTWKPSVPIRSRYNYSNMGFGILGWALANRMGTTYFQMINADILAPLGMRSTFVDIPNYLKVNYAQGYNPQGQPAKPWKLFLPGGGALHSTATDLLFFLEANLGQTSDPLLNQAITLSHQGFFRVNNYLTIGLAWQLFPSGTDLIIDKNGGLPGFSSYIGFILEKNVGIVFLANKSKINSTQFGRKLLKKLTEISAGYRQDGTG